MRGIPNSLAIANQDCLRGRMSDPDSARYLHGEFPATLDYDLIDIGIVGFTERLDLSSRKKGRATGPAVLEDEHRFLAGPGERIVKIALGADGVHHRIWCLCKFAKKAEHGVEIRAVLRIEGMNPNPAQWLHRAQQTTPSRHDE